MLDDIGGALFGLAAFTAGAVFTAGAAVTSAIDSTPTVYNNPTPAVYNDSLNNGAYREVKSQVGEFSGSYGVTTGNNMYNNGKKTMKKCVSCRAMLMGKVNDTVECEYCDTKQVLMDERN